MKKTSLPQSADKSVVSSRALAICIAFSLVYFSTFSQEKLIKDLNRNEYQFYNEYSNLVNADGAMYFISQGKELWKTVGTTTTRLRTARSMSDLLWTGSMLYFVGEDAGGGKELWKSDGTAAGTIRIKDIRPGSTGSNPHNLTDVYGTLYFGADNGTTGIELWKSNGTAAGTVLVKDINPGSASSNPTYLCNSVGMLMFSASEGKYGRELWKSDGTATGTVNILASVGREYADPQLITSNLNGWVYYTAWQSSTGRELWKSNGTVAGTMRVKDIRRGNINANIRSIVAMGTHMYFDADDGINGQALWKTNGKPTGTVMVKDLSEGSNEFGTITNMKMLNNNLYFNTYTAYDGHYYYRSDGTTAGTVFIRKANQYEDPRYTYLNGYVFFYTSSFPADGPYILILNRINADGTGLVSILDYIVPAYYSLEDEYTFSPELLAYNNTIVFPGLLKNDEAFKLLMTKGTPGDASVLYDTYKPTKSSEPSSFVKANGYDFFIAIGKSGDYTQLWRTDGTPMGTMLIKEFEDHISDIVITNIVASGNQVFITTQGFTNAKWQLWKSNGMASGTMLVKELTDQPLGLEFNSLISSGDGGVYFYAPTGALWKSNGVATGTVMLKDFFEVSQIAQSGTRAFAIVRTSAGGEEVWKTNGTAAGTVKIKTIRTGAGNHVQSNYSHASNEKLYYFIADDGAHGYELWRTDGTTAGTFMVSDIVQGDESRNFPDISSMAWLGDTLLFSAQSKLYITNGTNASTSVLSAEKNVDNFMPFDSKMIFTHRIKYYGPLELWVTDGTTAGTEYIRTLEDGSIDLNYTRINNFIYFTNNSNAVWRTDGDVCPTAEIDLNVTQVGPITSIGTKLIFGAYQKYYGKELYELETGGHDPDPCGSRIAAQSATMAEILTSANEELISYAPNPFKTNFNIQVNNAKGLPAQLAVYTITGVPVEQKEIATNLPHAIGERWSHGLYILKVTVEGKTSVKKIIKE